MITIRPTSTRISTMITPDRTTPLDERPVAGGCRTRKQPRIRCTRPGIFGAAAGSKVKRVGAVDRLPGRAHSAAAMRRFSDSAVAAVFKAYPPDVRARLMALRELVFDT